MLHFLFLVLTCFETLSLSHSWVLKKVIACCFYFLKFCYGLNKNLCYIWWHCIYVFTYLNSSAVLSGTVVFLRYRLKSYLLYSVQFQFSLIMRLQLTTLIGRYCFSTYFESLILKSWMKFTCLYAWHISFCDYVMALWIKLMSTKRIQIRSKFCHNLGCQISLLRMVLTHCLDYLFLRRYTDLGWDCRV